ncbi:hypothetical protein HK22_02150 [Gluconobacter sp. DsW_056]|uniref:hypothetical protein n=1 Tax=Gluconobacter sp. DsW_056 TaxID=1511209 RepID=UPI000A3B50C6|nr:hypothetical protein [Gluconobacter sp. DsW_056]OUI81680.1 hypothetical protein HK22_02150 [Gluconobacter sp. DsW_056]
MSSIQLIVDNPGVLVLNESRLKSELSIIGREIQRRTQQLILSGANTPHKPSKPGDVPNSLTGTLAKQIRVKVTKNSVKIVDTARQALALEAGANLWNGARVEARPYLSRVLEEMAPEIEKRIADAIGITIKVNP